MERPVIGIMGNTYMTQPGMFDSMERAYQNSYYVDAVMKNGGIPVILPASAVMEQTEEIMGICDGILFPGGEDMTPSYYGEDPHPAIPVSYTHLDVYKRQAVYQLRDRTCKGGFGHIAENQAPGAD